MNRLLFSHSINKISNVNQFVPRGNPGFTPALESFKASLTEAQYGTMGDEHRTALEARIEDYDFPFENLIFEGGGVKGLALIGAVKVSRWTLTNQTRELTYGFLRNSLIIAYLK